MMATLVRAIAAEFRKVFSTRLWWVLALILFGFVAFGAGSIAIAFGIGADAGVPIPPEAVPPVVYSMASATGYAFPVIFGAMSITSEVRHRTIGTVFLATPRRSIVLIAKAVVGLVVGAVYGIAGLAASFGLGAAILAATGQDALLGSGDTWLMLGRIVLAMALWGLVGVGVGVLVPSQIGSIVAIIAFTQFVEPILRTAAAFVDWLAELGRFLPGAASDALVGSSIYSMLTVGGAEPLAWWQGGLMLGGFALVLAVVGAATTWRRDVT